VLAAELPADVAMIYVHYLHTPASVARYAARMRGLPYAFSAHAKDIYTTPAWDLSQKIADAAWGATCTAANAAFLNRLAERPDKVRLVYHGLDLSRFPAPPQRQGRPPLTVLSVCRAVEKKGLDDLLRALARLPAGLDWRFEHVGGGTTDRLVALAERLGIAGRVAFRGARARAAVVEAYARADVFALASRVARNGDRDGLPNVIMEAMAMGLPVVSTNVSAVPEIVTEETGILVPERDPAALSAAIAALATDPARRALLGARGAARVRTLFSPDPGLDLLADRLGAAATRRAA
jgi:glycosyltransferase involved in cell wall biosynthesis